VISYRFEHPSSWSRTFADAQRDWPSTFEQWSEKGRDDVPRIRGWFRDESLTGLPVPEDDESVSAMVIGRLPMTSTRVCCWLKRTAMTVATDADRRDLDGWLLDEETDRIRLTADSVPPRDVRSAVRQVLGERNRADDIVLAASELAENATEHAGGVRELHVHRAPGSIVIEVVDADADGAPAVRRIPVLDISGRGMSIVDTIATHWGVTLHPRSKSVWCEFAV